jgi:hypothetical protein
MRVFSLIVVTLTLSFCVGCEFNSDASEDISVITISSEEAEKPNWDQFKLTPVVEYHDSLFIESLPALDVDQNGNIYVAAERHNIRSVYHYSPEGELLDTIGTFGTESGEFESIRNIQIEADTLFVFDDELSRLSRFHLSNLEFVNSTDFSSAIQIHPEDSVELKPVPIQRWSESRFLVEFSDDRNPAIHPDQWHYYYVADNAGSVDEIELFRLKAEKYQIGDHAGRPSAFLLPYPERSLLTQFQNGKFYTARTEQFEIRERNVNGSVQRIIRYPFRRATLNAEMLIEEEFSHNRQLQLTRASADYPEQWPALFTMFTDDQGYIWLALIPEDESQFEWWIIDPDKDRQMVQHTFTWPRNSLFLKVDNGNAYAVESDENGFKKVVKYKIEYDSIN